MHLEGSAYLIAATIVSVAGACFDIKYRIIPNFLTLPALVLAMAAHFLSGGIKGLTGSFAAMLVAGLIFAVFFMVGRMGGGDVKLAAAVSALPSFPTFLVLLELIA